MKALSVEWVCETGTVHDSALTDLIELNVETRRVKKQICAYARFCDTTEIKAENSSLLPSLFSLPLAFSEYYSAF